MALQNIQLSQVQELHIIALQLNHMQVTQGPAETRMDHTPFPGLTDTDDIF